MYYTLTKQQIENNASKSFNGADFWKNITDEDLRKIKKYEPNSIYTLHYYLEVTTGESLLSRKWKKDEALARALEIYDIWHN